MSSNLKIQLRSLERPFSLLGQIFSLSFKLLHSHNKLLLLSTLVCPRPAKKKPDHLAMIRLFLKNSDEHQSFQTGM